MNEEIYNAPESNLTKAEDLINDKPVFLGVFDKPMLIAVAIQVILIIVLSATSLFNDSAMSMENVAIGLFLEIFWAFFLVFLVRKIRGNKKISRKYPSVYQSLGAWGYLWRSFATKYVAFFFVIVLSALFSVAARLEAPSIGFTIVSFGFSFAASIVTTWLFFSNDRAGQFRWVLTIFRGY